MARLINDAGYARRWHGADMTAEAAAARFRADVLTMHALTNAPGFGRGHWQLPWPAALGTAPWSVARWMSRSGGCGVEGVTYAVRIAWPYRLKALLAAIDVAVETGHSVPVFVGNRLCPRHIALVLDTDPGGLTCYDPSSGGRVRIARADVHAARMGLAGWDRLWLAVLPTSGQRT